jgi:phosphoglycerate dehydrogenase-like enzyme
MKILVYYPFTQEQIQGLRAAAGNAEVLHVSTEEEAVRLAPEVTALLGHFPPAVFAAAKQLRWIQSFSAGMDNFLYPAVIESDVVLTNMAGIYASHGAEHAWALLLALARGLPHFIRAQTGGEWRRGGVVELSGGTLGIIGMGGFGTEIVRRAAGYEMTVLALDPVRTEPPEGVAELRRPTREALLDLLARSDAVMVACPKTAETTHFIGMAELRAMKRTAFLVCVTRGGIIDETALAAALRNGELAGAGLDVFEREPLPPESPLWELENVIITTHAAGGSQHRPQRVYEFFRENLRHFAAGEPLLNVVDKRRGF